MTDHQETDPQGFDWHAWNEGAVTTFRAFFFQYYPHFFSFANALLSDRRSAADLTTEALFLLWKKRKDFDSLVNAKTFLYTTIKYHSLNYLKHLRQNPGAGEYTADPKGWPVLPDQVRDEILAYAGGI